jgi:hypothetical protein
MTNTQITHNGKTGEQIVSSEELRRILTADGETCYCRPEDWDGEWDAGPCPIHD